MEDVGERLVFLYLMVPLQVQFIVIHRLKLVVVFMKFWVYLGQGFVKNKHDPIIGQQLPVFLDREIAHVFIQQVVRIGSKFNVSFVLIDFTIKQV
jgi:hypothetical protein